MLSLEGGILECGLGRPSVLNDFLQRETSCSRATPWECSPSPNGPARFRMRLKLWGEQVFTVCPQRVTVPRPCMRTCPSRWQAWRARRARSHLVASPAGLLAASPRRHRRLAWPQRPQRERQGHLWSPLNLRRIKIHCKVLRFLQSKRKGRKEGALACGSRHRLLSAPFPSSTRSADSQRSPGTAPGKGRWGVSR